MSIRQKILQILSNVMEVPEFDLEDCLEYEIDSLSFMYFIVTLEEEFNIEIPDKYLFYDGKETFENIIAYLQEWCNKNDN